MRTSIFMVFLLFSIPFCCIFSPLLNLLFLFFLGGLAKLPIVAREKAEISRIKKDKKTITEFGKRDSSFFRETIFVKTKIRVGYDNVQFEEITKFNKIVNSIKIKKCTSPPNTEL